MGCRFGQNLSKKRSCIYVLEVSILSLSTIFISNIGIVHDG
jgi:hypothetical protein